jgi:hypothetical protein
VSDQEPSDHELHDNWKADLLRRERQGLNSPDDQVHLIASLTQSGEIYQHQQLTCQYLFLLHFGFMDPEGNVTAAWLQHWSVHGQRAWQTGGRDRWLAWTEPLYPQRAAALPVDH